MELEERLIIYTHHAVGRMSVRRITKGMVRDTLANPEQTGIGYKSRFLAYKSLATRELKLYTPKKMEGLLLSL